MKTSKLFSTISWNTETYLRGTIDRLVSSGKIEWAHWIYHSPETGEKKEHYHIVIQPNGRVDTVAILNEFVELVSGEELPRRCLPAQSTKSINDWLLYAVHDAQYLSLKGEYGKTAYSVDDVKTTDPDLLAQHWSEREIIAGDVITKRLKAALENGLSFERACFEGFVPAHMAVGCKTWYYAALKEKHRQENNIIGDREDEL